MAKVTEIVLLTLMPMSAAAALSSLTARMALPIRVRLMKKESTTMMSAVTSRVRMVTPSMVTLPMVTWPNCTMVG